MRFSKDSGQSLDQVADILGCTPEQLRLQYARNAGLKVKSGALPFTVEVVDSVVGRVPRVPILTLNDAVAKYRAFIAAAGVGSSDAGRCLIRQGEQVVAYVSYNGRVWSGEYWKPGAVPIFDPSVDV